MLTAKEAIRILEVDPEQLDYTPRERDVKRVRGGLLVQDPDRIDEDRETMTVPTEAEPTEAQWERPAVRLEGLPPRALERDRLRQATGRRSGSAPGR